MVKITRKIISVLVTAKVIIHTCNLILKSTLKSEKSMQWDSHQCPDMLMQRACLKRDIWLFTEAEMTI